MPSFANPSLLSDSLGVTLLATCPDSIIVTDGSGLITEWNPAAERAFVCPRHEAIGSSFLDFLFASGSTETSGHDPTSSSIDTIATRSDGSTFPCTVTIASLRGAAKILYVRELVERLADDESDSGLNRSRAQHGSCSELAELTELAESAMVDVAIPKSIVVVDDSPDIRDFLSSALSLDGRFDVITFACGAEAITYLESEDAALILLDMELGTEAGDDVARTIRELEHHSTTPMLALTGHRGAEYRQRSRSAGCNDHLVKPITHQEIVAAIERQLSGAVKADEEPFTELTSDEQIQSRIEQLIPDFLASRQRQAERIAELIDIPWPTAEQLKEVRDLGHQLKGCGTTFGFQPISQLGDQIEAAAESCDQEQLRSLTTELRIYLEKARSDFATELLGPESLDGDPGRELQTTG